MSRLGENIATDGEWAVVSSRLDSTIVNAGGAAIVYRRGPDGWSRHSKLRAQVSVAVEQFSRDAVDIRGTQIAVGSWPYRFQEPTGPRGRVHVFEFDGTEWQLTQELIAPDFASIPGPFNGFGFSVRFGADDELLVSAPSDQGWLAGVPRGSIYVFRKDSAGVWQFTEKVRGQGPLAQVPFMPMASSLEIAGDVLVSHAEGGATGPTQPIAIYERDQAGHWALTDEARIPNLTQNSTLWDFDLSENFLVVGDSMGGCQFGVQRPGSAHVFQKQAAGWVHIQTLESRAPYIFSNGSGCAATDLFGYGVAVSGDRIAVGALEGAGLPGRVGSVEVFQFDGTQFIREYVLLPSEVPHNGNLFGSGVDITDNSVIVGAPNFSVPTNIPGSYRFGATFFYDLPRGAIVCEGQANSTGRRGRLAMFGSSSAEIGDVYGKAQAVTPGQFCLPLIGSTTDFVPAVGGGQGNLCIGGELGRLYGQVGAASASGEFEFDVQAGALPLAAGPRAIMAGDAWVFQVWYRDTAAGTATHNFTHAVRVEFDD